MWLFNDDGWVGYFVNFELLVEVLLEEMYKEFFLVLELRVYDIIFIGVRGDFMVFMVLNGEFFVFFN